MILLAAAGLLPAAETALENTGKPMLVPFECTPGDSEAAALTCTEQEPCPVFLELSGVEAVGNRIFVSGNLHTANATLYSILLATEDAGKIWSEAHPRIRFAALDQVQFIDFENGWISGANLLSTPRDPFFLLTTDGGKTWRERPIYDESRPGVIERFWFDSRTSGTMLVDARYENRHELYETMTGGESWSLRQASANPIPFPRNKGGASNSWRLHADGPANSYFLERSQGEHWQKVASFLVNIGKCKQ
jgi:photosystem II stability/assembly factor-like uncharacterized protein